MTCTVQGNLFKKTTLTKEETNDYKCKRYYTSTFTMARYSIQTPDLSIIQLRPRTGHSIREVIKRQEKKGKRFCAGICQRYSGNLPDIRYTPGIDLLIAGFVQTLKDGKNK